VLAALATSAALLLTARYFSRHRDRGVAAARRLRSAVPASGAAGIAASVLARLSRRAGAVRALSAGLTAALVAVAVAAVAVAQLFDNVGMAKGSQRWTAPC